MPTITIRATNERRSYWERRAQAEGVSLSELTRRALDAYEGVEDSSSHLEDLDKRVSRLEEMAGLS